LSTAGTALSSAPMRGRWRIAAIALAGAVAFSMPVSAVRAASPTREEYVDRTEVLCKSGVQVAVPILHKAVHNLRKNRVRIAGPQFVRAASVYDATRKRLLGVAKPAADERLLETWLKRLGIQNRFLRQTGESLDRGKRVKAQGYLSRFVHSANLANDLVLEFGFDYCLFHRDFA
jgi:hypothetical protein